MDDSTLTQLKQIKQREEFERRGTGPWTVVYKSWNNDDSNGGFFAAFTPPSSRSKLLESTSWDLSIGEGQPGFIEYWGKRRRNKYLRYGNDDGIEPIVIVQSHHGIKPRMLPQLAEEFRLFHNLWVTPDGTRLYKVYTDGNDSVAVEVAEDEVSIRTNLLRQFQAGRQLDLMLYVDSIQFVNDPDQQLDLSKLKDDLATETMRLSFHASDHVYGRERPFSRLFGKKVLAPPPRSKAGIWPFEEKAEEFQEFIIGEDENGELQTFSCNPDALANYFGANPKAPHYLTPVYFRREVLQKYYEHPEKFEVRDGYLSCGSLWGVQIDNNHPRHVMVFLGDVGRDLPESERNYWKSFNIPPIGGMSRTTFRRSFLAQFADAEAPDLRFKSLYTRFNRAWQEKFGWALFKPLHEADAHVLQSLRVPLSDSQPEFEQQVFGLTKLLVASLNEAEIRSRTSQPVAADAKGLDKLETWLAQEQYPHTKRDVAFLRRLQRLRSKMAAHRKGSDYEKTLGREGVHADKITEVVHLLVGSQEFLKSLGKHFDLTMA